MASTKWEKPVDYQTPARMQNGNEKVQQHGLLSHNPVVVFPIHHNVVYSSVVIKEKQKKTYFEIGRVSCPFPWWTRCVRERICLFLSIYISQGRVMLSSGYVPTISSIGSKVSDAGHETLRICFRTDQYFLFWSSSTTITTHLRLWQTESRTLPENSVERCIPSRRRRDVTRARGLWWDRLDDTMPMNGRFVWHVLSRQVLCPRIFSLSVTCNQ